jgi:hypothetical protein
MSRATPKRSDPLPRWVAALIALVAMPLLLVVAILAGPYYAIVRLLMFIGVIPTPRPTGTIWGTESAAHAEVFAPMPQEEIVQAVVADIERELTVAVGNTGAMRVEWMREQGACIANVSIESDTVDVRALLTRVLNAGRLTEVREL